MIELYVVRSMGEKQRSRDWKGYKRFWGPLFAQKRRLQGLVAELRTSITFQLLYYSN